MSYGTAPPRVIDGKEQAMREGRYFVFSTGEQVLGSSQFLNILIANPAGSSKRLIVTRRRFDNNVIGGQTPLAADDAVLSKLNADSKISEEQGQLALTAIAPLFNLADAPHQSQAHPSSRFDQ